MGTSGNGEKGRRRGSATFQLCVLTPLGAHLPSQFLDAVLILCVDSFLLLLRWSTSEKRILFLENLLSSMEGIYFLIALTLAERLNCMKSFTMLSNELISFFLIEIFLSVK